MQLNSSAKLLSLIFGENNIYSLYFDILYHILFKYFHEQLKKSLLTDLYHFGTHSKWSKSYTYCENIKANCMQQNSFIQASTVYSFLFFWELCVLRPQCLCWFFFQYWYSLNISAINYMLFSWQQKLKMLGCHGGTSGSYTDIITQHHMKASFFFLKDLGNVCKICKPFVSASRMLFTQLLHYNWATVYNHTQVKKCSIIFVRIPRPISLPYESLPNMHGQFICRSPYLLYNKTKLNCTPFPLPKLIC